MVCVKGCVKVGVTDCVKGYVNVCVGCFCQWFVLRACVKMCVVVCVRCLW